MSYGYKPSEKDIELAEALSKELGFPIGRNESDKPYISTKGSIYNGVAIRKMTHLSREEFNNVIEKADTIYKRIVLT